MRTSAWVSAPLESPTPVDLSGSARSLTAPVGDALHRGQLPVSSFLNLRANASASSRTWCSGPGVEAVYEVSDEAVSLAVGAEPKQGDDEQDRFAGPAGELRGRSPWLPPMIVKLGRRSRLPGSAASSQPQRVEGTPFRQRNPRPTQVTHLASCCREGGGPSANAEDRLGRFDLTLASGTAYLAYRGDRVDRIRAGGS